jgi:hypothetical protein
VALMTPVEAFIREAAARYGIDPDVAVRVAHSEGGLADPFRRGEGPAPRSQAAGLGATENSFGPFQLYVSGNGAGLGDRAVAAGIDPRKDWQGGVDYALAEAAKKGWGQWYGAGKAGIGNWQGIGGGGSAPGNASMLAGSSGPYTIASKAKAGGQDSTPAVASDAGPSPYALALAGAGKTKTDPREKFAEMASSALSDLGKMPKFDYSVPPQPGAANVQAEVRPLFDPQQQEGRRQQLAMLLQRLNQGALV